jgi:hypothetical protein
VGFSVTVEARLVISVLAGLFLFGCVYNWLVEQLETHGHDRGFMSLIVALGCAVTIGGYGLIVAEWRLLALAFGCFTASGTPMIVGSIIRYVRARSGEEQAGYDEARRELSGQG